jgi:hypothetical protein
LVGDEVREHRGVPGYCLIVCHRILHGFTNVVVPFKEEPSSSVFSGF